MEGRCDRFARDGCRRRSFACLPGRRPVSREESNFQPNGQIVARRADYRKKIAFVLRGRLQLPVRMQLPVRVYRYIGLGAASRKKIGASLDLAIRATDFVSSGKPVGGGGGVRARVAAYRATE